MNIILDTIYSAQIKLIKSEKVDIMILPLQLKIGEKFNLNFIDLLLMDDGISE